MALCLATSLVECGGFDARDQMERYVRWWREGCLSSIGQCFDIGDTTIESLKRFEETGDPFAGTSGSMTAGNGSIMRLAPAPMFFVRDAAEAIPEDWRRRLAMLDKIFSLADRLRGQERSS